MSPPLPSALGSPQNSPGAIEKYKLFLKKIFLNFFIFLILLRQNVEVSGVFAAGSRSVLQGVSATYLRSFPQRVSTGFSHESSGFHSAVGVMVERPPECPPSL